MDSPTRSDASYHSKLTTSNSNSTPKRSRTSYNSRCRSVDTKASHHLCRSKSVSEIRRTPSPDPSESTPSHTERDEARSINGDHIVVKKKCDHPNSPLLIITLNVGGSYHIMDATGTPLPHFLLFVSSAKAPFLMFLNDIQLRRTDVAWQHFCSVMQSSPARVLGINGPRGEALLVSKCVYAANTFVFPECPPDSDHVEFHLRKYNIKNSDTRLVIVAPYFAFEPSERRNPAKAVAAARQARMVPENVVFFVGDMNLDRYHKTGYAQDLITAGFIRIETPITGKPVPLKKGGFGGGRAQAIWTTHPDLVTDVRVLDDFDMLSDHHRPLTFRVPGHITVPSVYSLDTKSKMRRVMNPSMYQKATREVQRGPNALAMLQAVMFANTKLVSNKPTRHKARLNNKDAADATKTKSTVAPSKKELRRRLESGRARLIQMEVDRSKRIFAAAYKNEPLLKRLVLPKRRDERTMCANANEVIAKVWSEKSWVVSPVTLEAYFGRFADMYSSISDNLKAALVAKFTAQELHDNLHLLGPWKTYTDYEGRALHLFDNCTLEILADSYNERAKGVDVEAMVRQIIGLPTGKKHNETEIPDILRKENRPIGLSAIFDALYFICQNTRLAPIVAAITPKNMHGFIRGREGHDMIVELLFAVEFANRSSIPIWSIQGDIEKHFDQLPHEGIAHLDKLLGLAEPFFATIVGKIRRTVNEIRIQPGEPGRATQLAGGSQGDQRTPSISALLLAPLARALKENVDRSIPADAYAEMKRLLRIVVNFADDWVFTSDSLDDAMKRFCLAADMCQFLGMTLKLVAIACNHHATGPHSPKTITYRGERFTVKGALRILGACIHFKPDSDCATTKCKGCDKQAMSRLCTVCLPQAIVNLGALPLPILDKVEIGNQRILASLAYGAYTCERQQAIWENAGTAIRHQVYGYGYGGYKVAAHLPAPSGGLGLKSSREHLAIETASILERVLCRNGAARDVILAVRRHKKSSEWPQALAAALKGSGTDVLKFDLHTSLLKDATERRSQDAPSQIEIMQIGVDLNNVTILAVGRSLNGSMKYYHDFETRPPQSKKWTEATSRQAQIRLLARIVEKESLTSRRVVIKSLPGNIALTVGAFRANEKSHFTKDRAYTSVLARTEIITLTDDASHPNESHPQAVESDYSIPELFPMSVTSGGIPFVKTSLNFECLNTFRIDAERQYRECKQIAEIIQKHHEIDHENSACAAGTRRGVHYESLLRTSEANTHLRLVTGALIKTPVLAEENVMPGTETGTREIKWGEVCKARLSSSLMAAECGLPLTLAHVLEHVTQEELDAVTYIVNKTSKFGDMTPPLFAKYMALGFMPKGLYRQVALDKQKEFKKHMMKTATEFARIGQRQFLLCQQKQILADATPDFVIKTGAQISLEYEYLALADAAQSPGKNPGEPCTIGLGGHIIRISTGEEVKRFMVRRQIPSANSTLAEHFAHLILTKMTASLPLNDVCFGSDNNAVPNQNDGNWKVNCRMIRSIRGETAAIKATIRRHAEAWFPRAENSRADLLSKLALTGHQEAEAGWVAELDELLHELFDELNE